MKNQHDYIPTKVWPGEVHGLIWDCYPKAGKTQNSNYQVQTISVEACAHDETLGEISLYKEFDNFEDADDYYDTVIRKYPASRVSMKQNVQRTLKNYR